MNTIWTIMCMFITDCIQWYISYAITLSSMCTIYLITSLSVVGKLLSEISDDEKRFSYRSVNNLAVSGETLIVPIFSSRDYQLLFYQLN